MPAIPPPAAPAIFAVTSSSLQISWREDTTRISIEAQAEPSVTLHEYQVPRGGAGSVVVDDLNPDTRYRVVVVGTGGVATIDTRTLVRPPGELLAKIATMNDLHLGLDSFGLLGRMKLAGSAELCAQAALDAAVAWGADRIVLKGDMVDGSTVDEWDQARALLAPIGVPIDLLAGNHESAHGRHGHSMEQLATFDGWSSERVRTVDLAGLRLVLVDTTVPDRHGGTIAEPHNIVAAVAGTVPALVLHHHHFDPRRIPRTYPFGIHGPRAAALFSQVAAANPNAVFASGHTHRHRRRTIAGLVVTELGSTKDYPGTWCGYSVYEGGFEATAFRVPTPEATAWLDRTGAAVSGVWSRWSPGRLDDRCFSLRWSERGPVLLPS